MTNKEWLASLSAEQFYDEWIKVIKSYGIWYNNTRLAMIEWLEEEREDGKID